MIKNIGRYLVILGLIMGLCCQAKAAETADEVLKRVETAIKTADGISASFTITSGSHRLAGSMKSSGDKFALETSSVSTWYDGKTMWTYNAGNKETTVTTPTASELADANPLFIVKAYSSNFTAAFAKSQAKGSTTIVLTPKSKKLGYKSVYMTIPDNSSFPSQVIAVSLSGQRIIITISQTKKGIKFQSSTFTYPKSKYPNAEIVDLR